ncbi:EI24 domain-containing protein, partial [bacterium]|nr:EI24 domain-containing protein [bacterium]
KLISQNNLRWYFVFPLIFNVLIFAFGFTAAGKGTEWAIDSITQWGDFESWTFWGAEVLGGIFYWVMYIFVQLFLFIVFAYIGGYIVLILMSPIFAILSEKVETILTGKDYPFSLSQFLKDIQRGVLLALRNLGVELMLTVVLFVLSFIPVVGWLSTLALFFISSYFYGFSYIDYSLERKKMDLKQSVKFVRMNKGLAIGNGMVFSLLLLIPVIGIFLAGFASIVAVTAATMSVVEMDN